MCHGRKDGPLFLLCLYVMPTDMPRGCLHAANPLVMHCQMLIPAACCAAGPTQQRLAVVRGQRAFFVLPVHSPPVHQSVHQFTSPPESLCLPQPRCSRRGLALSATSYLNKVETCMVPSKGFRILPPFQLSGIHGMRWPLWGSRCSSCPSPPSQTNPTRWTAIPGLARH